MAVLRICLSDPVPQSLRTDSMGNESPLVTGLADGLSGCLQIIRPWGREWKVARHGLEVGHSKLKLWLKSKVD